jgi:hypothetical protein
MGNSHKLNLLIVVVNDVISTLVTVEINNNYLFTYTFQA